MSSLGNVRFWFVRINWRVFFAGAVWLAAPRMGLEPSMVSTVRDASSAVIVLAFLAWANQNGSRKHDAARHGIGVLGTRQDDTQKGE